MRIKKTFVISPERILSDKLKQRIKIHSKIKSRQKSLSYLLTPQSSLPYTNSNSVKSLQSLTQSILSSYTSMYYKLIITSILKPKLNHFNSQYNEMKLYIDQREHLKRFYSLKETKHRLSKYYNYYKNYLHFFCKPSISDLKMNGIMMKNMEKAAQVFYNNNYGESKGSRKIKVELLFTEGVVREIEKNSSRNTVNNNYFDNDSSDNDISNINMNSFVDVSKINPKSSTLIENRSTAYSTSMNNQNAKAFSLDQTLNTSINVILSMLNEKEEKKANNVQFTKIKKTLKINQHPSSSSNLLLNAYNNFNFPINFGALNNNNTRPSQKFKLNTAKGSLKNILSKVPSSHNISSIKTAKNIVPLINTALSPKTPMNRINSNTLIKNKSTSNLNRPQSRAAILSSPTVQHRNNKNFNAPFSSSTKNESTKVIFSCGKSKRNIKNIYPKLGSLTSTHRDMLKGGKAVNRIRKAKNHLNGI